MGEFDSWMRESVVLPAMRANADQWIQTYTGKKLHVANPDPDDICIEDIAYSLSNQSRFTGHCKRGYSVAQHSVLVSNICNREDALWGLLHDATEAYLTDVAAPVKRLLIGYKIIEDELMKAIAKKFGLSGEIPVSVKEADAVMLATEKRDLMGPEPAPWELLADPAWWFEIRPWGAESAEKIFLKKFEELTN